MFAEKKRNFESAYLSRVKKNAVIPNSKTLAFWAQICLGFVYHNKYYR